MILAKLRVEHHEARERGEGSAAQQLGTLRDGGVRAQLNDEGRVQRDGPRAAPFFVARSSDSAFSRVASSKRSSATAPSPIAAARSLSPPSPFSLASAASLSRWVRACRTARASRSMCTRCFRDFTEHE